MRLATVCMNCTCMIAIFCHDHAMDIFERKHSGMNEASYEHTQHGATLPVPTREDAFAITPAEYQPPKENVIIFL